MIDKIELVTGPAEEPVSVVELKKYARISTTTEDDQLYDLIVSARMEAERHTRRQLVTATQRVYLTHFPRAKRAVALPRPPLQSVTSVEYLDSDLNWQAVSSSDYYVTTFGYKGTIQFLDSFTCPGDVHTEILDVVRITFVAGYGIPDDVPQGIRNWIKSHATNAYDNRGVLPNHEELNRFRIYELG